MFLGWRLPLTLSKQPKSSSRDSFVCKSRLAKSFSLRFSRLTLSDNFTTLCPAKKMKQAESNSTSAFFVKRTNPLSFKPAK